MKSEVKELGKRVRWARSNLGLSQPELGRRVGKSKQLISAWESGRAEMSATMLARVASALSVDAGWLASGQDSSLLRHGSSSQGEVAPRHALEIHLPGVRIHVSDSADTTILSKFLHAMRGSS